MKLGDHIRAARQYAHMTQAQLAHRLKCTEGYIAHLEHGRSLPSEPKLLELCEILNLDKREMILRRQREKAADAARPYYEPPETGQVFFREGHTLTPEQVAYAMKVIRAVEANDKVKAAIDLILGDG